MGYKETMGYVYARCKGSVEMIIVSFKQNLRIINKATNRFLHYNEEGKKIFVKQGKAGQLGYT